MNNDRFQAALNYIGDDLIAEAADCKPSAKAKPALFIKHAGVFACTAAAALAGAVGLKLWADIKFGGVSLDNQSNLEDAISVVISNIDPANAGDSSPGIRFLPAYEKGTPTLEEWRNFNDVIWNTNNDPNGGFKSDDTTKDRADSDDIKLGTVKISDKLQRLAAENPSSACAALVSFKPCRKEAEMDAWKYDGMTIGQIKNKLKITELEFSEWLLNNTSDPEASFAYKENINYLAEQLDKACYDYYLVKLQEFYDTFRSQNLEIYPVERGSTDDYCQFYCFIYNERLNEFACKPDEAFYFELAER